MSSLKISELTKHTVFSNDLWLDGEVFVVSRSDSIVSLTLRDSSFNSFGSVAVALSKPFSDIPLQKGDLLGLQGAGLAFSQGRNENNLEIVTEDCEAIRISVIKLEQEGKSKSQPIYSSEKTIYFARNQELKVLDTISSFHSRDKGYTKLGHLKLGFDANVMAIVVGLTFPTRTKRGDFRWALRVLDDSSEDVASRSENGVEVTVFQKTGMLSTPALALGDVIRLRRAKVEVFQNQVALLANDMTSMMLVVSPTARQTKNILLVSQTEMNWDRVLELRTFFQACLPSLSCVRNAYTQFVDVSMGFVDLIVRVQTLPTEEEFSFRILDALVEVNPRKAQVVLSSNALWDDNLSFASLVGSTVKRAMEMGGLLKIRHCRVSKESDFDDEWKIILFSGASSESSKPSSLLALPTNSLSSEQDGVVVHPSTPVKVTSPVSIVAAAPLPIRFTPPAQMPPRKIQILSSLRMEDERRPIVSFRQVFAFPSQSHRVRCRVKAYYPASFSKFTRRVMEGQEEYVWAFGLLLVEESTTGYGGGEEEEVEAYVSGPQGTAFFQIPPCNLLENNESLRRVERCMAQLLGNRSTAVLECLLQAIPHTRQSCKVWHTRMHF